jgi:hypothetical protein
VRTAVGNMVRAAPSFPWEGAPGLHGVVVIVRIDLTAEPPAHCRLVSDHDLFEIVACFDCTAYAPRASNMWEGRTVVRSPVMSAEPSIAEELLHCGM